MTYTLEDFGPFKLSASSHASPSEGMCAMEMVSFLAGEEWSDRPSCSSPIVARYCQMLNDTTDQAGRDRLQTYVPRLIGTASAEHDVERAEYLAWAAIRIFAPIALEALGLQGEAEKLRAFRGDLDAAADAAYAAADAAYAAADAAYAAAHAAHAAAHAAYTAYTAYTAAHAAHPAYTAAHAAADAAYAAYTADAAGAADAARFNVLDGLLEIGPSGNGYTDEHFARVASLKKATMQNA